MGHQFSAMLSSNEPPETLARQRSRAYTSRLETAVGRSKMNLDKMLDLLKEQRDLIQVKVTLQVQTLCHSFCNSFVLFLLGRCSNN